MTKTQSDVTLLVVDDNPANLNVVEGFLATFGYEILVARNGESAIQKALLTEPDLILLDVMLPDISGFDVCKTLKETPSVSDIPVIFMTVLSETEDKVQGFQVGGVDYITKPIQQEELHARVRTHLRLHSLTSTLEEMVVQRTKDLVQANQRVHYLARIVEQVSEAVITTDLNHKIQSWNKAAEKLYGWTEAEVLNKPIQEMLRFELTEDFSNGEFSYEVTHTHKSGDSISIMSTVSALYDDNDNRIATIFINRDMTEQKLSEERRIALALEKDKNEFISNMSHDLKTPLSVLSTSLYLLDKAKDEQSRGEKVERMQIQITRLEDLINDIMTISRLTVLPKAKAQQVLLSKIIYDIVDNMSPKAQKKHIKINTRIDENSSLMGSERDFYALMENLIENAINYTQDFGTVNVTAGENGDEVTIEVSDTGMGIAPTELPKIFDRFYRGDQARSTISTGAGLGLAIVNRVVELHNGEIQVRSEPNVGTTFSMTFPK